MINIRFLFCAEKREKKQIFNKIEYCTIKKLMTHGCCIFFFLTAYLSSTEEVNVIAVDWSPFSISLYPWAVEKMETVGKKTARMIDFFVS